MYMNRPVSFEEYLAKEMENPEFRAEWDALKPEFQLARSDIEGHGVRRLVKPGAHSAPHRQAATP